MTGWRECCFIQMILEDTSEKRSDIYTRLGCSMPCVNVKTTLALPSFFYLCAAGSLQRVRDSLKKGMATAHLWVFSSKCGPRAVCMFPPPPLRRAHEILQAHSRNSAWNRECFCLTALQIECMIKSLQWVG